MLEVGEVENRNNQSKNWLSERIKLTKFYADSQNKAPPYTNKHTTKNINKRK
jgi:hypothetical protein